MLDWDDTRIVFTKRSLIEFLKSVKSTTNDTYILTQNQKKTGIPVQLSIPTLTTSASSLVAYSCTSISTTFANNVSTGYASFGKLTESAKTTADDASVQGLLNSMKMTYMTSFQERTTFGRAVEFVTFQAANTQTFLHQATKMMLFPSRLLRKAVLAYAFCHHSDNLRYIHLRTSPRKLWNIAGRTRTLPQLLIPSTKASTSGPDSGQPGGFPIFRTYAKPLMYLTIVGCEKTLAERVPCPIFGIQLKAKNSSRPGGE